MSGSMRLCPQSCSPISPMTTGTCRADRVHQLLHAGRREVDTRAGTAVAHAGPSGGGVVVVVWVRLVVEVEDDRVIVLELLRDAPPVGRRVVAVGHRLLIARQRPTRRTVVQIDDDVHAGGVDAPDVVGDSRSIARPAVLLRHSVDSKPAVLVAIDADGIEPPFPHVGDRGVIGRAVEDARALGAGVLRAGSVGAEQADHIAVAVDEMVAGDADGQAGMRLWRPARGLRRTTSATTTASDVTLANSKKR